MGCVIGKDLPISWQEIGGFFNWLYSIYLQRFKNAIAKQKLDFVNFTPI